MPFTFHPPSAAGVSPVLFPGGSRPRHSSRIPRRLPSVSVLQIGAGKGRYYAHDVLGSTTPGRAYFVRGFICPPGGRIPRRRSSGAFVILRPGRAGIFTGVIVWPFSSYYGKHYRLQSTISPPTFCLLNCNWICKTRRQTPFPLVPIRHARQSFPSQNRSRNGQIFFRASSSGAVIAISFHPLLPPQAWPVPLSRRPASSQRPSRLSAAVRQPASALWPLLPIGQS